jgi:hypothetical protein
MEVPSRWQPDGDATCRQHRRPGIRPTILGPGPLLPPGNTCQKQLEDRVPHQGPSCRQYYPRTAASCCTPRQRKATITAKGFSQVRLVGLCTGLIRNRHHQPERHKRPHNPAAAMQQPSTGLPAVSMVTLAAPQVREPKQPQLRTRDKTTWLVGPDAEFFGTYSVNICMCDNAH